MNCIAAAVFPIFAGSKVQTINLWGLFIQRGVSSRKTLWLLFQAGAFVMFADVCDLYNFASTVHFPFEKKNEKCSKQIHDFRYCNAGVIGLHHLPTFSLSTWRPSGQGKARPSGHRRSWRQISCSQELRRVRSPVEEPGANADRNPPGSAAPPPVAVGAPRWESMVTHTHTQVAQLAYLIRVLIR